jgi:hypothetical protein
MLEHRRDRRREEVPMSARLLLFAALAAAPAGENVVWKAGFGREALWNDGQAEVSVYEATDRREGRWRSSRAILVVVAEDLLADRLVKADDPSRAKTRRVLKFNHLRSIPAGLYTYQQMLSVFADADRLVPVKLTMTSHEWCGNSFVEWRSDTGMLAIRSYFEIPGDVDAPLDPREAVFYDALPLELRGLDFERTRSGRLRVIDSVFSSKPAVPPAADATIEVERPAAAPGVYRVRLSRGDRRDTFEFERAFPHRLARWDRSDGGSLKLQKSIRSRYWEKTSPGDEHILAPPGTR